MAISEMPTEAQRGAFVERLHQFRAGLTPPEQRMLDTLVVAACGGREPADVEGYWFRAPIDGQTLAQVWRPYWDTATYMGEFEPL